MIARMVCLVLSGLRNSRLAFGSDSIAFKIKIRLTIVTRVKAIKRLANCWLAVGGINDYDSRTRVSEFGCLVWL